MQFATQSLLAIMATLSATSSAFVMDTYSGENCGGTSQSVNVWDNTCATWPDAFKSFKINTWGGSHQKAWFFAPDNCGSLPGSIKSGYVDSTTNDFKFGDCYGFSGSVANAVASYSA